MSQVYNLSCLEMETGRPQVESLPEQLSEHLCQAKWNTTAFASVMGNEPGQRIPELLEVLGLCSLNGLALTRL